MGEMSSSSKQIIEELPPLLTVISSKEIHGFDTIDAFPSSVSSICTSDLHRPINNSITSG